MKLESMKSFKPCNVDVFVTIACSTLGMKIKATQHIITSFCIQSYFIYPMLEIDECIIEKLLLKVDVPDSVTIFDRALIFEW